MLMRPPPPSPLPYTTLFRSLGGVGDEMVAQRQRHAEQRDQPPAQSRIGKDIAQGAGAGVGVRVGFGGRSRSEEDTSELQLHGNPVCRVVLEKKKRGEVGVEL